MHDFFPELARRIFFSLLGIMGNLVPEAFFYSFLANFATRTASFIFLYRHETLRAEKRKPRLSFLSARRFDQRFCVANFQIKKIILKESLWDQGTTQQTVNETKQKSKNISTWLRIKGNVLHKNIWKFLWMSAKYTPACFKDRMLKDYEFFHEQT